MEENNKIQDGEVVSDLEGEASEEEKDKKRKRGIYVEMVLFFILGILIGITLKTEAIKKITMGFNDYQMSIKSQAYDINKIQADLAKKSSEEKNAEDQSDESQNGNQSEENMEEPQNQAENGSGAPVSDGQ